MSNAEKQETLVKLFLCYPSSRTIGQEDFRMMVAAYLETLSIFSSGIVSNACDHLRRRAGSFPPTAGDLYAECDKIAVSERKMKKWKDLGAPVVKFILPAPRSKADWTFAQLADWNCVINGQGGSYVMRVGEDGMPLPIPSGYPGHGHAKNGHADYGYLTPREIAAKRNAGQIAPRSFHEAAE